MGDRIITDIPKKRTLVKTIQHAWYPQPELTCQACGQDTQDVFRDDFKLYSYDIIFTLNVCHKCHRNMTPTS